MVHDFLHLCRKFHRRNNLLAEEGSLVEPKKEPEGEIDLGLIPALYNSLKGTLEMSFKLNLCFLHSLYIEIKLNNYAIFYLSEWQT